MTPQRTLETKNVPEKFTVGEWVDFRKRVEVNLWEGSVARVTRVNGFEVHVNIDGDERRQMAFFPRRSDGKYVRMLSPNGSVPDYEFAPTWIFHGKTSKMFARAAEKAATESKKKESRLGVLGSLRRMLFTTS